MRVTLNNTLVFVGQARRVTARGSSPSRSARCRRRVGGGLPFEEAAARRPRHAAADAELGAAARRRRRPPRPLPGAGRRRPRRRARGGTLRVHLDAEPHEPAAAGRSDAAGAQVTNGLVYETLLDCRDGTYRPGLAESWDVSNDGMRIGRARAQRRALARPPRVRRARRAGDASSRCCATGTDAPVLRAELADVASIELVTERTVRFVLKRPSDFALRALCDVPILPDHLVHGVRPESSPIARQPVGHRAVPLRRLGARQAHPPRARARILGRSRRGVDEIVFDLDPDAVRALNRTRRGELDVLPRVLDVHYPDQVEPTTLHGATTLLRLRSRRYSFLVVNHLHYPLADPRFRRALALLWDRARFARELHKDLARPIGGPPLGDDIAGAAVRSRRAPSRCSTTPATATPTPTACAITWASPIRLTLLEPAGNRHFHVEAHAFALEVRKAGILVDLVPADAATILARLKHGEFDLAPHDLGGAPDEDPGAALRRGRRLQLRRLPVERARGADRRGARRGRAGGAARRS